MIQAINTLLFTLIYIIIGFEYFIECVIINECVINRIGVMLVIFLTIMLGLLTSLISTLICSRLKNWD